MSFDRIKPPAERLLERDVVSDPAGKAALFTGGGERPATAGILDSISAIAVECARCGALSGLDPRTALRSVLPMALYAPWREFPVFAICPAGRHRAWLKIVDSGSRAGE
jgi:hypothetical protein